MSPKPAVKVDVKPVNGGDDPVRGYRWEFTRDGAVVAQTTALFDSEDAALADCRAALRDEYPYD